MHGQDCCSARDTNCHKCTAKGHFQIMCHTKGAGTMQVECDDDVLIATVDGDMTAVDRRQYRASTVHDRHWGRPKCYIRADIPGAKRSELATYTQVSHRTQLASTSCM